jgi:hypothetical protein
MPISEPQNPVAAHIGSGVVQIHVEPPLTGVVLKYQVQTSFDLAGPYVQYSSSEFKSKDGFVLNVPLGKPVYMQVRAIGVDYSASQWVQIRAGAISKPTVRMECIAPRGSLIPKGSIFCVPKLPGRLLGFVALEDINFT